METKLILKDALNGNFTLEIRDNPDKQKTFLSVDLKYKNKDNDEDEEVMDFYINKHDLTQLIEYLTTIRDEFSPFFKRQTMKRRDFLKAATPPIPFAVVPSNLLGKEIERKEIDQLYVKYKIDIINEVTVLHIQKQNEPIYEKGWESVTESKGIAIATEKSNCNIIIKKDAVVTDGDIYLEKITLRSLSPDRFECEMYIL